MAQNELDLIIKLHTQWRENITFGRHEWEYGGKRANFKNGCVRNLDFSTMDLRDANFENDDSDCPDDYYGD